METRWRLSRSEKLKVIHFHNDNNTIAVCCKIGTRLALFHCQFDMLKPTFKSSILIDRFLLKKSIQNLVQKFPDITE